MAREQAWALLEQGPLPELLRESSLLVLSPWPLPRELLPVEP